MSATRAPEKQTSRRSERTGRRRTSSRQQLIDTGVLILALSLGVLGFGTAFGSDARYLLAGMGGVVMGLAIAWTSARFRLGLWSTAGIVCGTYLLLGNALAAPSESFLGFLPTLESLRVLILGVVTSWKDILTVAAPVGISRGMLIVPFLSALLTSVVAGLLAWRVRTPYWVLLPVIALFGASIIFGTNRASLPELRGIMLIVAMLAWLAYRRDIARTDNGTRVSGNPASSDATATRSGTVRRLGYGAAMVAGATAITVLAVPLLTSHGQRQVLRDVVVPPVELFDYPSPLMDFRQYVKTNEDKTLFTVDGLPEGERVRLAALDAYNGVVYNVNPQAAGNFARVGDAQQLGASNRATDGTSATLDINIKEYDGVWLPSGGQLEGIALSGPREGSLEKALYYNDDARTALSTIGLQEGDSYQVNVTFPDFPTDEQLAQYDFAGLNLPRVESEPPIIASRATEYVGAASKPIERVRRLQQVLHSQGYFSNGKDGEPPSLPGHGAKRMTTLLDAEQMVGDDEQYAVAMALMARKLNIPARVVMGFYPDWDDVKNPGGTIAIKGKDVHAWVEVAFDDAGWIPFDPTPDEDNEPIPPQQQPKSTPKPQVLQPPPPPQEPAELPPDSAPEPQDADKNDKDFWAIWGPLVRLIGIAMIPVGIILIPLLLILLLKTRRRKRRSREGMPSQRVGGGWKEVLSFATDMGASVNTKATRRESARNLKESFPASSVVTTRLAHRADAGIFGASEPSEAEVQEFWQHVESSLDEMSGTVGFWKRQRARYSPRSLFQDARNRTVRGRRPTSARRRDRSARGDAGKPTGEDEQ
ncbi:transglutaminaseTgpA domain-containing protein [Arthrobacter roseus]|uniref:transglutaminaseTgpA domain-containing protein n=1 Tax=Arthrobacter roseus TaxID=136274 RepID=UPI001966A11A|nr:transglutaminaseTgpA domain-containing protein [Arthrobacter roseus]MBM7848075.1 hypothetical protein [Arthrobacter roseus]